jgi:gag-polypeptide of LTR copia-type
MSGEDQKTTLLKLSPDRANWVTFCNYLLYSLDSSCLCEHIQSNSVPTSYTTAGDINGLMPIDHWAREEGVIRTMIGNSIPDLAFNKIKSHSAVKDIYDTLKQVYKDYLSALVADLIRCFQNKKCRESKSVHIHFKQLANIQEQLSAMGKTITDIDYLNTLIASLPSSYKQACVSISASNHLGAVALTADIFEQYILNKSKQHTIKNQRKDSKDEAFATDAKKDDSKDTGKDKDKPKWCSNCQKHGHVKADCWAKGRGKEGQGVTAGSTQRCCADCVLPADNYCCCCTSAQALLAPCSCSHSYCFQCSDPYC